MGKKTGISWCDHTFNPWIGCTKVSAGCANCYAERDNNLHKWVHGWGEDGERRKTSAANWKKPLAWNRAAKLAGIRRKVFCASLADVFEDRPELVTWRNELFDLIEDTPDLDWLLLTKRPENVLAMFDNHFGNYGEDGVIIPDNVWMGTTAENQEMADKRIPFLFDIPASTKFISAEPLLEKIDILQYLNGFYSTTANGIDWVIAGGESGPSARPMERIWAIDLLDQCETAGTPFFFKQHGGTKRIDGHWGGDLLAGVQYHEFPETK
jgi:protein gp37